MLLAVSHLGIVAAFGAGLLSFLSPCVFPLVPGYLSYIAGTTVREAKQDGAVRWRVTVHAMFFVLGFSLIFALLGAAASTVGVVLASHRLLLERVAGVSLIVFGLFLARLVPLPVLFRERRAHIATSEPAYLRSAVVGAAFGAGWSPCIGPILGAILALAAAGTTLAQGVGLLLVYALGLGVPFILVGVVIDRAAPVVRRINRYTGPIAIAGGVVMVMTGVLIVSGRLAQLAQYAPLFNV